MRALLREALVCPPAPAAARRAAAPRHPIQRVHVPRLPRVVQRPLDVLRGDQVCRPPAPPRVLRRLLVGRSARPPPRAMGGASPRVRRRVVRRQGLGVRVAPLLDEEAGNGPNIDWQKKI